MLLKCIRNARTQPIWVKQRHAIPRKTPRLLISKDDLESNPPPVHVATNIFLAICVCELDISTTYGL